MANPYNVGRNFWDINPQPAAATSYPLAETQVPQGTPLLPHTAPGHQAQQQNGVMSQGMPQRPKMGMGEMVIAGLSGLGGGLTGQPGLGAATVGLMQRGMDAQYKRDVALFNYTREQAKLAQQREVLQQFDGVDIDDPDAQDALGFKALSLNMPQVAEKAFGQAERHRKRNQLTKGQRAGLDTPVIRAAQIALTTKAAFDKSLQKAQGVTTQEKFDNLNHTEAMGLATMFGRMIAQSALSDTEFGRTVATSASGQEIMNAVKKFLGMDANAPNGVVLQQMDDMTASLVDINYGAVKDQYGSLAFPEVQVRDPISTGASLQRRGINVLGREEHKQGAAGWGDQMLELIGIGGK